MNWLTLLMVLPLIGSVALAVLPKENEKLVKQVALASTLVVMGATIAMAVGFQRDNTELQFVEKYAWIPSFGINYALGVDGLALVLILMSTILAPVVVLAGWNESQGGRWSVKTFYILILVLETMMIGVFAATDVFLFYVIFEAMLIPVYFLIGGYGSGERSAAAVKFLIYSLFGGLMMLASIIALYVMSGAQGGHTFDLAALSQLQMSSMTQNLLFLGFFIAFAIKAPLWPLHTWLPDAAESATPGTSVLLLGVLDKVGTFGMIRYCLTLFPDASKTFTPVILVLAVISIIYCAVFPTVFCFTLQNIYQRYVTPTRAGLVYTLDPVWSLIAGFFVLGERLNSWEWLGCGIIFLAALMPLLFRLSLESRLFRSFADQKS